MKINPAQIAKAMEIYKAQKPAAPKAGSLKEQKQDELILSDKAQAFQVALKSMEKGDGVDYAKVQRLKREIESGEYDVDPNKIAHKMVEDLLSKRRV